MNQILNVTHLKAHWYKMRIDSVSRGAAWYDKLIIGKYDTCIRAQPLIP